ncbi:MAG: DUF4870 domain-containing protein [Bellilinea sp.]
MSEFQTPTPPANEVTSDDRLWAMLSYLLTPLFPIIILLMGNRKNRPYLKAHYVQALVLGVVLFVLFTIINLIPVLGQIVACVLGIAYLVVVVLYAIKANKGEYVTIPVITNFVKNQGWA